MRRYKVAVTMHMVGGDEFEVIAKDDDDARRIGKKCAESLYEKGELWLTVNEICVTGCDEMLEPSSPYPDPATLEWALMGNVKHPLPEGTLILSLDGEEDCDASGKHGFEFERDTGINAIGKICSVDHWPAPQGWSYGVLFEPSGVYVTIDEGEYYGKDANVYLVAI